MSVHSFANNAVPQRMEGLRRGLRRSWNPTVGPTVAIVPHLVTLSSRTLGNASGGHSWRHCPGHHRMGGGQGFGCMSDEGQDRHSLRFKMSLVSRIRMLAQPLIRPFSTWPGHGPLPCSQICLLLIRGSGHSSCNWLYQKQISTCSNMWCHSLNHRTVPWIMNREG